MDSETEEFYIVAEFNENIKEEDLKEIQNSFIMVKILNINK